MAQRAYRNRKETTITSLEKQVQELRGANEEMNNMFITLHDLAVAEGLLQREPKFGQQLQSTFQRFLALAKTTAREDGCEEQGEESGRQIESDTSRRPKASKPTPRKQVVEESYVKEPTSAWGYIVSKDDSPDDDLPGDYQGTYVDKDKNDLQVLSRPSGTNASKYSISGLKQIRY